MNATSRDVSFIAVNRFLLAFSLSKDCDIFEYLISRYDHQMYLCNKIETPLSLVWTKNVDKKERDTSVNVNRVLLTFIYFKDNQIFGHYYLSVWV